MTKEGAGSSFVIGPSFLVIPWSLVGHWEVIRHLTGTRPTFEISAVTGRFAVALLSVVNSAESFCASAGALSAVTSPGVTIIVGGAGADTMNGNSGVDTVNYGAEGGAHGVRVNLLGTGPQGGLAADTYVFSSALGGGNVDAVVGFSALDDTIAQSLEMMRHSFSSRVRVACGDGRQDGLVLVLSVLQAVRPPDADQPDAHRAFMQRTLRFGQNGVAGCICDRAVERRAHARGRVSHRPLAHPFRDGLARRSVAGSALSADIAAFLNSMTLGWSTS